MHIYGNGNYGIIGVLEEQDLVGTDIACTRSGNSPYYAVAMQYTKVLLFPVSMEWEPGVLTDPARNRILQNLLLSPDFGKQMHICETGSGLGYLSLTLSRWVQHVTFIDKAADGVESLAGKGV